jgi:putative ABC transport system substrate-binding protein
LRYQPRSRLSRWYQARFGRGGTRARKVGIVALARKLLIELWRFPEDFDGAFQSATRARAEALMVVSSRFMNLSRPRILEFVSKQQIPLVTGWGPWVRAGGLLSYGPDLDVLMKRAASHVDRILKGAKPADIPVEQPTKFELVINLKTAKALGLTIPPSVLGRADQIIE